MRHIHLICVFYDTCFIFVFKKLFCQIKINIQEEMYTKDSQRNSMIASMEKIINYIQLSDRNSAQIFFSLSKNDIQKILHNFSDENSKLRKLSLTFLGTLLNGNIRHKYQFCRRMQIPALPGKICLNLQHDNKFQISQERAFQLVSLLKQKPLKQNAHFEIWMVNLRKFPLTIDYIPISTLSYIDPLEHLVGFVLLPQKSEIPASKFFNLFDTVTQCAQGVRRKPEFGVVPSTQRFSSRSTQQSNRFNRTSNNKTSLKQSLRGSVAKTKDQSVDDFIANERQTFIRLNQNIKSQAGSPKKDNFLFSKGSQNSINKFKNIHRTPETQSNTHLQSQYDKKTHQPVIVNTTNIYINTPVNSISINQSIKPENERLSSQSPFVSISQKPYGSSIHNPYVGPSQKPYVGVFASTCKNSYEKQHPNRLNQQRQSSKTLAHPMKRYERVTQKHGQNQQKSSFNYEQYREFMNRIQNKQKNEVNRPPIF